MDGKRALAAGSIFAPARTAALTVMVAALASAPCVQADASQYGTADSRRSPAPLSAPPESRWAVELRAGRFEPDIDNYDRFYGNRHSRDFGLSFAWRLRNWLEAGGSIGRSRDTGLGLMPDGSLGGDVEYVVMPAQAWVSLRWDRGGQPLVVPYVGIGIV